MHWGLLAGIVIVLVIVIGVPITLLWWKFADQWADAEQQRFHRPGSDTQGQTVVRTSDTPARREG